MNSTGRLVQPKTYQEIVCSCSDKCSDKINADRQRTLFEHFYNFESYNLQTAYVYGLIDVATKQRSYKKDNNPSRRSNTRLYHLTCENGGKVKVCKDFFKKVFKISDGRLTRILKTKVSGLPPPSDKRGKHAPPNKTSELKIAEVKDFINKFPAYQSHYSRKKNPNRKYLAPDLSLGKIYNMYKNEVVEAVSQYVFSNVFNQEFNLCFHAPITDSCKKCDSFKIKIDAMDNEIDKQEKQTEHELHLRKADSARDGMTADAELAKADKNITIIAFDLMKTLPTPLLSTGVAYYKRQLWTYCLGIHNLATDEVHMYLWDESIASRGPDEIGSCLLHYVEHYVRSKKLIMYSDQCGGQNRNIKLALICNYIVSSPGFTVNQIDHKFLVSGHTFLPCDQDFGLIEKKKKLHKNIFLPQDWTAVIKDARKKKPFNIVAMTSNDFFSTNTLKTQITNRHWTTEHEKVEWLKMQWLQFKIEHPFKIYFKYSNNELVHFMVVDIAKRKPAQLNRPLELLYPNSHQIDAKKKKDLLELCNYIPPIFHNFYEGLKTTENPSEDFIILDDENEENLGQ